MVDAELQMDCPAVTTGCMPMMSLSSKWMRRGAPGDSGKGRMGGHFDLS